MHGRASELLTRARESNGQIVTTDYVLDETATLLRARGHGHLGKALFNSKVCQVQWMDPPAL